MIAVLGTGTCTLQGALIAEKSIRTSPDTISIRSATVSSFTVHVARINTHVAVKSLFTSSGADSSIPVTRSVTARATVIRAEITVEASGAVGCTTSTQTFASVIETARLTSFIALFSVKPHCARTYARALRSVTGARSTWRLARETIKPIDAPIYARAVGVKTRVSITERTASVLAPSSPVPLPTSTKTASCRPVARTHAMITTLVARISRLVIVAVTSITPFTDPARRASSGTYPGSCVTRGPGCYIYTTLATSRARGEVGVVTTDTSGTRQVAGRTAFTIGNVALT